MININIPMIKENNMFNINFPMIKEKEITKKENFERKVLTDQDVFDELDKFNKINVNSLLKSSNKNNKDENIFESPKKNYLDNTLQVLLYSYLLIRQVIQVILT